MVWSKITLPRTDDSAVKAFRLPKEFESIFFAALTPERAAMFQDKESEYGCTFYFSPEATAIFSPFLKSLAITPLACAAPTRESVSLLVGHANARDMLPKASKSGKSLHTIVPSKHPLILSSVKMS